MKRLLVSLVLVSLLATSVPAAVIPSGSTTDVVQFAAVQSSDSKTPFTTGTTFTVEYIIGNGTRTAMDTPTVTNKGKGVYTVLVDEPLMTVVPAGKDCENLVLIIEHTGMDPVTREVEVWEPWCDIALITGGRTVAAAESNIRGGSQTLASVDAKIDIVDGVADNIKLKTDLIPASPAAVGSPMNLADDAITAPKFDQSTAHPQPYADPLGVTVPGAYAADTLAYIIGHTATSSDLDGIITANAIIARLDALEAKLTSMIRADGADYEFTPAAVEEAPTGTGSGLTAQQTRDAMKLAPSAGAADAGSIDALIAAANTTLGTPAGVSVSADIAAVKSDAAAAKTAAEKIDTSTEFRTLATGSDTPVATAANQTTLANTLGTPAGASVSADIAAVKNQAAAIETDTQDLQAQIGTDGAGLTAIGDTRLANLDATVSSRSSHDAAAVKTALETDGGKLDHVWEMTQDNGTGTRQLTADALEHSPTATGGFTADDRTKLETIHGKLPSKAHLTGTANADGDIQMNEATGNFPGTVAKSPATLAADDVTGNIAADVKAYTTQPTVTGATLSSAYDAAKTAARAGDAMTLTAAYDPAKTAAQAGVDGDTLKTLSDQIDGLNNLSSAQAQAAVAAALAAYDVPTEAQMNARTLPAADYFDPATDPITVSVDVDEAAIAAAMLGAQIDGVAWQTILEAQLADLCGRVTISGSGSTRTYTYYKRDNATAIMTISVTVPTGARSAAGQIGQE